MARAVRTSDRQIRQFIEAVSTKDPWYCNNPIEDQEGGNGLDSPILAYFSLFEADKEDELSYGDREDTDKVHIDYLTILSPENPNCTVTAQVRDLPGMGIPLLKSDNTTYTYNET